MPDFKSIIIVSTETSGGGMKSRQETKGKLKGGKSRLFHDVEMKTKEGVIQNVQVDVRVEQPDENCLSGCFKMLGSCLGKAAKS